MMTHFKRVGVLTGGGDCPGLNAVVRAVTRSCFNQGIRIWGIKNGFGGLVENQIEELSDSQVSGILHRGGTILGTTNRDNPFKYYTERNGVVSYRDMSGQALENLRSRGIEALIVIGGDGSLAISGEFDKLGFPVVGVPKTIDNDIPHTERTFGFDTAVACASDALDRLHTTAESHHRVMVLEVMGRYAGWIAFHSGMAGGAYVILIPELPFRIESVVAKINARKSQGKLFSLIVIAEGAFPAGGEVTVSRIVEGSAEKIRLGGVGEKLARQIEDLTGAESRCTTLGHLQRGGSPTAFDRVLATRYGVAAVDAIVAGKTNCMVALQKNEIVRVPIQDVAGQPSNVPLEVLHVGRSIGISFGD
jgi:ATP-dependent phosphofructokinase / diphosphate-dependent phosphofructokinase